MRAALDEQGATDVSVLVHVAKYAFAVYGLFREAVDSQLKGDCWIY